MYSICTYMRRTKFSQSEKDKFFELTESNIAWKSIEVMFGCSKNTLKSMIRREKIVRSLPPKLMAKTTSHSSFNQANRDEQRIELFLDL